MPQARGVAGIKPISLAAPDRGPSIAPSTRTLQERTHPLVPGVRQIRPRADHRATRSDGTCGIRAAARDLAPVRRGLERAAARSEPEERSRIRLAGAARVPERGVL